MWIDLLRSSTLIAAIVAVSVNGPSNVPEGYEAKLSSLLQTVVSEDGLVDYNLLRGPLRDSLREIVDLVEVYNGPLESDDQKKAFWMNAYNVHMLLNIVENPDVRDIIEDGYAEQFFKSDRVAAGRIISLDEIEHTILRRQPADRHTDLSVSQLDPRIHVGLNCAAVSCPRLLFLAFTQGNVDFLLQEAMIAFVSSEKHFRVELDGTVVLSSLLDWFSDDFEPRGMKAGDFLLSFMPEDRPDFPILEDALRGKSASEIRGAENIDFEYLWLVNDIKM